MKPYGWYNLTIRFATSLSCCCEISTEVKIMEGIHFLVNDKGEKTAVVIDLKKYGDLWEDFYDILVARLRADEPRESIESVKRKLYERN